MLMHPGFRALSLSRELSQRIPLMVSADAENPPAYVCDGTTTQIGLFLSGVKPSGMDTDIVFVPGPVMVNVFEWIVAGPLRIALFEVNSIFFYGFIRRNIKSDNGAKILEREKLSVP